MVEKGIFIRQVLAATDDFEGTVKSSESYYTKCSRIQRLFNFFWVYWIMAKKITTEGTESCCFLCVLCSFPKPIPKDNKKSPADVPHPRYQSAV
jgi:hypothetical protein